MDCYNITAMVDGDSLTLHNCSVPVNDTGMSSNDSTTEMPLYFWLTAPIATFLYACIFVVGVIGNLLVCYVVAAYKDMRDNIFHIFLANLSVADLLVVAVCVPTAMVDVFSQEIWYLGEHMCKFVPFLEYAVTHVSVLTILAISFERFVAIIFPLKAQYLSTRNRSFIIIVVIWMVSFVTCIPFALIAAYKYEVHSVTDTLQPTCTNPTDMHWKRAYYFLVFLVFFVWPFFILCMVYAFISHHLIKDSYKSLGVATDISQANMRARKQVVLMLATVVATFFIFLLPFRVLVLWTMYATAEDYDWLGPAGWYPLLYFARIMFYLNSASNPIVLYAMSSKFRTKFQHILCCRPLPVSSQVSRSGTLRYSVRTEYSNSFRRPEFDTRSSSYSFKCKSAFGNGNGNGSGNGNHTFLPIEESPML